VEAAYKEKLDDEMKAREKLVKVSIYNIWLKLNAAGNTRGVAVVVQSIYVQLSVVVCCLWMTALLKCSCACRT
jgi:hypothetical protein